MVVTCLWTAQFVPLEHRLGLFRRVRERINKNGCFIIAEKLRGQNAAFQEALVDLYHDDKATHGYSVETIRAKADSLEGRLVSYTAPELKAALQGEGFHVEEVARYLQFGLWYCLPR
jgi:tRNA (cmo5U34)-methyltransferase